MRKAKLPTAYKIVEMFLENRRAVLTCKRNFFEVEVDVVLGKDELPLNEELYNDKVYIPLTLDKALTVSNTYMEPVSGQEDTEDDIITQTVLIRGVKIDMITMEEYHKLKK